MRISEQFKNLFRAIARGAARLDDVNAVLAGAAMNQLPMPQLTWMLVCLVAYIERLHWAWKIVHERLPEEVDWALQTRGEREGTVPDMPNWRYEIGGVRLDLSHKGTGERLALSLDKSYRFIQEEEFITYYCRREPGAAEQQLREFFPRGEGLFAVLRALARSGMVRKVPEGLELGAEVYRNAPQVAKFLDHWGEPTERLWLAITVGDWPAAHEAAVNGGNPELVDLLAPLAEQCRQRWQKWLRREVEKHGVNSVSIGTLARSGIEDSQRYFTLALADADEAPSVISLIADDSSWCPTVYRLIKGECRRGEHAGYYLKRACVAYLSRHRYRIAKVIDLLLADRDPSLDLLIPLVLEHRQECLLPLLRRGLRSDKNEDRQTAVAVLLLFDADWSRRELVTWLREADDWEATIECRLALRDSRDGGMWELVDHWEAKRPEEAAAYSTRAWTHTECFRRRVTELFDLVYQHRRFRPDP
jgi:hypothetical protein